MRFASNLGSVDGLFDKERFNKANGEENSKAFTYFLLGNGRFIYASTARLALIKVINSPKCNLITLFSQLTLSIS